MEPAGPLHHGPLGIGPALAIGERADAEPFPERRQVAVLGFGIPQAGAFRQPKFRTTTTRLSLLASQPVSQGVDQVIVRELVVLPAR